MFIASRRSLSRFLWLAITVLATPGIASDKAERDVPGAPRLLPVDTLAYIRIDDMDQLRQDFRTTSVGRMIRDPALEPLVSDTYQMMADLFEQAGNALGVSLDELLSIPSGQVAAAVLPGNLSPEQIALIEKDSHDESPEAIRRRLARKRQNQTSLAGWFMIDAGDQIKRLRSIVGILEERLANDGYVQRNTEVEKTKLIRWLPPRPGRPEIEFFERDRVIILGIGHGSAAKSLNHWNETSDEKTLADRSEFATVMSRCIGADDTRPQVTSFADLFHLVERLVKRGGAAGLVWPIIEDLGLAKIRAVGGSTFQGGETFESVTHVHILIDPPRDGFFGVLRPETGENMPPSWVPDNVTSYTSIHWDFEKAYENFGKILDKFRGPKALQGMVEDPIQKAIDVSVAEELHQTIGNRYVRCRWVQPPMKLNSQTRLDAISLKDPNRAKEVFAKIRQHYPKRLQVDSMSGHVVYEIKRQRPRKMPPGLRSPEPCFVILNDWLISSDSRSFLKRSLQASAGSVPRLVNTLQFEIVVSELGGKLDGEPPYLLSFLRGSDYVQQIYELAGSEDTRRFLRKRSKDDNVSKQVLDLIDRNALPPFEQFRKYFAPSGTFAYDEPTGIHTGFFTLRSEKKD